MKSFTKPKDQTSVMDIADISNAKVIQLDYIAEENQEKSVVRHKSLNRLTTLKEIYNLFPQDKPTDAWTLYDILAKDFSTLRSSAEARVPAGDEWTGQKYYLTSLDLVKLLRFTEKLPKQDFTEKLLSTLLSKKAEMKLSSEIKRSGVCVVSVEDLA